MQEIFSDHPGQSGAAADKGKYNSFPQRENLQKFNYYFDYCEITKFPIFPILKYIVMNMSHI